MEGYNNTCSCIVFGRSGALNLGFTISYVRNDRTSKFYYSSLGWDNCFLVIQKRYDKINRFGTVRWLWGTDASYRSFSGGWSTEPCRSNSTDIKLLSLGFRFALLF